MGTARPLILGVIGSAIADAASPRNGARIVETTPGGYTLAVSVSASGKAGHLTLSCPDGHSLGASPQFAISGVNLIRFLGNELRIPLVGVGTREAYLAIRSDDQLEDRFEPFVLPRWEPGEDACSLLASFAASFPLRRASQLATPDMTDYLLTRSEGTIGDLAHLLTDAAVAAIESGEESINQRTLLIAPYAGPSERRRLFERELA